MPCRISSVRTAVAIVAACTTVGLPPALHSQTDADQLHHLDTTLTGLVAIGSVRGAALVVVRDTGVVFQRGYGSPGPDRRVTVDPEQTVFRAASLSKLFVATAVLQLQEQGRVDLGENVDRYLRGMSVSADGQRPITLHALLTHTSGIENRMLGALVARPEALISLDSFFRRRPPRQVSPAGEGFQYSNIGMAFAGYLVETVSGASFDRYAERHILAPLGMLHSSFQQPIPPALAAAMGDSAQVTGAPLFLPYPAASLVATPADMGRFVRAHLNGGAIGSGRILRPETEAVLQATHWTSHPHAQGVAYGFFESMRGTERALFHTGDAGDHSLIYLLPDRRLGLFVVLRGVGDEGSLPIMERLVAQLSPGPAPAPASVPVADAGSRAGNFSGLYGANGVNPFTIERAAGLLQQIQVEETAPGRIRAGPTMSSERLTGIEVEPFRFQLSDGGVLTFVPSAEGRSEGATLSGSIWDPSGMRRLPWYRDARLAVATMLATLLLAGIRAVMGLRGMVRRLRGRPGEHASAGWPRRAWHMSGIAAGALLLGPVLALGSVPFLRPPITTMPIGVTALLACWLVGVAAGIPMVVLSWRVWRERAWTAGRRTLFSLLALAIPTFGVVLSLWNLLGFRY